MTRSLGGRLRQRLRRYADVLGVPGLALDEHLPMRPSAGRVRDAIVAVESSGRDSEAEELAHLLLAVDRDGDTQSRADAGQLLLRASPRVWLVLDAAARRAWWRAPNWSAVAVRRLLAGEPSPLGLAVTACHPDGHVREAAVALLVELDDPLALPALALRAADWVPQIRDRARPALEHRLAQPTGSALVVLSAVALALRERRQGRWLADRIEAAFRQAPAESLTAALTAADWRTRRTAHLAVLDAGRFDLAQLLHAAQHDDDLPTRTRCAEAAVRIAVVAGTIDLIRPLLASGTAMVRAETVYALARSGDITPAHAALADRSPLVRGVAQGALRRNGADPAPHYRRLVAAARPQRGAIAGLGETVNAADTGLIRAQLAHPQPRARAEAVRALRRLGAADPVTVSALLTDPSGAVTRQATLALRPHASRLDPDHLRELLATHRPQHIRIAAYRLLHGRDIWTRLLTDLELVTDPAPSMRNRARDDLASWLARGAATTYAMPQGRTADALHTALRDAKDVLEPAVLRQLRFHLGLKPRPAA